MLRRHLLLSPLALAAAPEIADTTAGKVRGTAANGVTVFRGIPYGKQSRFLPPSKPEKWTGVRNCTETGPRCIQGPGNIFLSPMIGEYFRGSRDRAELAPQPESEDCLVLNVLTPSTRGKRPVMVYIHGGGFTGASSHLTLFADKFPGEQDVVLVGINHRINVFGYLHLGAIDTKYETGNIGQLDLIAALEWIRANIANFGGDPGNVTIFGESGGAAKISALLFMPAAHGLFQRAILESGSILKVQTAGEAAAGARALLAKVPLDRLLTLPAPELFKAAAVPGLRLMPAVDGRSLPEQLWQSKPPIDVPLIVGCCKDETTLFSLKDEELYHLDDAGLRSRMPDNLIAAYRAAHPKDTPSDIWFRYATDRERRADAIRQAELYLERGKSPVFMYHFVWNTPLADGKIRAFHTAELPLAIRLVRFPESEPLSKTIANAWANFARLGTPKWPRYTLEKRATQMFDAPTSSAIDDPDRETRRLITA
jgi:para-nitrobenzyl esterase